LGAGQFRQCSRLQDHTGGPQHLIATAIRPWGCPMAANEKFEAAPCSLFAG
jgi:hypothetical protein